MKIQHKGNKSTVKLSTCINYVQIELPIHVAR